MVSFACQCLVFFWHLTNLFTMIYWANGSHFVWNYCSSLARDKSMFSCLTIKALSPLRVRLRFLYSMVMLASLVFIFNWKFYSGAPKLRRETSESKKEQKTEKKEQKKEKRREEKEKKKEKRQKEGISRHANGGKRKDFEQYYQLEKSRGEPGIGCLQKVEDAENEQLERSGITEEHEQPLSPRELSDCNQSCNKRKRSSSPSSHDQR